MESYENDALDDLMYDSAEGPAGGANAFEDEFDAYDEFDEGDDEFLGTIARGLGGLMGGARRGGRPGGRAGGGGPGGGIAGGLGNLLGGLLGADEGDEFDEYDEGDEFDEYDEGDEFDEYDEGDEFIGTIARGIGGLLGADEGDEYDEGDELDAADDMVADALDADDSDEFLSRLRNIAGRVGRGIGSVARTVAPIASMIPLPQAQLIGRLAGAAGRLLADGADEFEAYDEMIDGLDEDEIDAAAPLIAGLALRRALPAVARMAAPARRRVVRAATQAVRGAVRAQGRPAARVVPRAIAVARRVAAQRRAPARRVVPRVVRRVTARVVRRPAAARALSRPLVPRARRVVPQRRAVATVRRAAAPVRRRVVPMVRAVRRRSGPPAIARPVVGGGAVARCNCPRHGRRVVNVAGPATIRVRCR